MNPQRTFLLLVATCAACMAWTNNQQPTSRRSLLQDATSAAFLTTALSITPAPAVAASTDALLQDLRDSQDKLQPIPDLLEDQQWDKVRSILKTPPVNKLWNLGDSQNPVLQLAKSTGNIELFELKDELAYNLQLCDQITYDNVFVYFQPGNGKVKIKEPKEFAKKAMSQLAEVIESASS